MKLEKSDIIEWLSEECMDLTFEDWLDFIQAGTRFSSDEGRLVVKLAKYYRIKAEDLQEANDEKSTGNA